jgi:hypothetical protein
MLPMIVRFEIRVESSGYRQLAGDQSFCWDDRPKMRRQWAIAEVAAY